MSFMFNPNPYDDLNPINKTDLKESSVSSLTVGTKETAAVLTGAVMTAFERQKRSTVAIALDGYPTADWTQTVNLLTQNLSARKIGVKVFDVAAAYKEAKTLENQFADHLPEDREKDPVLLFGKLLHEGYNAIFDSEKAGLLTKEISELIAENGQDKKAVILFGCGCSTNTFRKLCDLVVFFDVTPKQAVLRIKNGKYKNLGDTQARPFKEAMRRAYYIDFEMAGALRGELLRAHMIDYYIASDDPDRLQCVPKELLNDIFSALAIRPFRCKPVYLEGVWGGQYVKKIRKMNDAMNNIAWVFDLIPLEVSVLTAIGNHLVEFPYYTFVQHSGNSIMGAASVNKFGYYFPIRFNYDDTFHSNGNMSIQVHPGQEYCKENYSEHGRQDESYYIVATGHNAKTYVGFKEDADPKVFIQEVKRSEKEATKVDHDNYVNSVPSTPGMQFMLPAGTIHASGRNQLILEIGSLTVGSYTFKMYDYLRADLDGIPRPIHTYHGERVLKTDRRTGWVSENLVQKPREIRKGEGFSEYIVGEHDLIYFSLRRVELTSSMEDDTAGKFHVFTLVDGESVVIESIDDPKRSYTANYLDVVVVPAAIGRYRIRNIGKQPAVLHKTMLKNGFEND